MKRILILTRSVLPKDPRILRHISALGGEYEIIAAAIRATEVRHPAISRAVDLINQPRATLDEMIRRKIYLHFKSYERYYWLEPAVRHAWRALRNVECDLIIANDLDVLPLADKLVKSNGAKLLFDAHEYYPGQYTDETFFRFYKDYYDYQLSTYLPVADRCVTVGKTIAETYAKEYGIPFDLLTNATEKADFTPSALDGERIRMVHHGNATRLRETEVMVEIMRHLPDRFSLDLILVNKEPDYHAHIERLAEEIPKVQILSPVPYTDILKTLNGYDLGFYMLPQTCFNMQHALPNKLYEFVQARLGIAIWPSPEMARIVKDHKLGVVAATDTVASMVEALADVTAQDVAQWKRHADTAAETLNAETNAKLLRSIVCSMLEQTTG